MTAMYHIKQLYWRRYDKPPLAAGCCHVANDLTNFTGDRLTLSAPPKFSYILGRCLPVPPCGSLQWIRVHERSERRSHARDITYTRSPSVMNLHPAGVVLVGRRRIRGRNALEAFRGRRPGLKRSQQWNYTANRASFVCLRRDK